MPEPLLQLRNLKKYFPVKGRGVVRGSAVRAVDGLSLDLYPGETLGIVGESGCGKSTLGRLALRLIEPTAGSVIFQGTDITKLPARKLADRKNGLRREMQMVFQNPYASFNPRFKLGASLAEVCRYYKQTKTESHERIHALLTLMGLQDELLSRRPKDLSGGQLQRFALVRALLSGPRLVVADEPLSALDVSVQAQLLNLLVDIRQPGKNNIVPASLAMLFISHDITVVEYLCGRVAVMYLGKIVEFAETRELFSNTLHPYTKALCAAVPRFEDAEREQNVKSNEAHEQKIMNNELSAVTSEIHGCSFAPRCPFADDRCRTETPVLRDMGNGHLCACRRV
jgi:oligopeptide/dipeptide ABC transporter ATP-binding protein